MITILLRSIRRSKGYTIRQLEQLSGVSDSHISAIERGEKIPTIDILCRLADAMEIDEKELYERVE